MTPIQLHILRFSVGLDDEGNGRMYRNHYVTGFGSDTYKECCELVKMKLMEDLGMQIIYGGANCFQVTPEGKKKMKEVMNEA